MYAFRKTRDTFKKNKSLIDQKAIQKEIENGLKNLDIIKRQVCFKKQINLKLYLLIYIFL